MNDLIIDCFVGLHRRNDNHGIQQTEIQTVEAWNKSRVNNFDGGL